MPRTAQQARLEIQKILGVPNPKGVGFGLDSNRLWAELGKLPNDAPWPDEPTATIVGGGVVVGGLPALGRRAIITAALPWVGTEETTKNRFKGDAEIWAATDYGDGWKADKAPYCAAFVCRIVQIALPSLKLRPAQRPKSASTEEWQSWARSTPGVTIFKPSATGPMLPQAGDIVNFRPHFSHIGIVESYEASRAMVHTIEANTDGQGSREGDGIWQKERRLAACGEFYRLPA